LGLHLLCAENDSKKPLRPFSRDEGVSSAVPPFLPFIRPLQALKLYVNGFTVRPYATKVFREELRGDNLGAFPPVRSTTGSLQE
jgi:hypothetical protein